MNFFHQRKEQVTSDEHQIESYCGWNVDSPKHFIKKFFNFEYVSKKSKKKNKKTGQNETKVERKITI